MVEKTGPSDADRDAVAAEAQPAVGQDLTSRLVVAFGLIKDEKLREQLVALVESVAAGQVGDIGLIE